MGRPPQPKTGYSDVLLREMNEVVQTKDGQKKDQNGCYV